MTVAPANNPPPAPQNITTQTGNDGEIILSWDSSSGATGYKIYYDEDASNPPWSPTDNGSPSCGSDIGNVTSVTISSLTSGGSYWLAAVAYNASGNSPDSTQVQGTAGSSVNPPKRIQVTGSFFWKDKRKCDIVKGGSISPELSYFLKKGWKIGIATNNINATFHEPRKLYSNRNGKNWKYKSGSTKIRYINGNKSKLIYKRGWIPGNYIVFIEAPK